ncbi:S66 peptidase family protein [Mechercharimyces sp. CAU 1602]|uniref:S66 family peptidase n=1 Tax=Mechercharimyces sp. CAU 1602 TaxID=2973933 RepID=UPI002163CC47|nr:S66 peptidase family protein [Mechercharimyces sp. CAU 1602]MCS1351092.1 LD-carboxypeptidase [Mechercharimyces sp. CAU 1602]
MIRYPFLPAHSTIGVTAPSSGVRTEFHYLLQQASTRLEQAGYTVQIGKTAWQQEKAKSAPADERARELMEMMEDDTIHLIIPPFGGELLIEVLDKLDFSRINPKWVLGYSDLSLLLMAMTLQTGIATAHGTNFIDLRGQIWDETTAMWEQALSTEVGSAIVQSSSSHFQTEWKHDISATSVFHLTEPTEWKSISPQPIHVAGRVLGGCIDIIRHLMGTPYGDVATFQRVHLHDEPLLWYFENCELSSTDLRRSLVQMKLAGWFEKCSGILFGRSNVQSTLQEYTEIDVYHELADELGVPIIYDIDCGHQPPQVTFINGAYAEVEVNEGRGRLTQYFRP